MSRSFSSSICKRHIYLTLATVALSLAAVAQDKRKLTPEEIFSKHVESIGTKEAIAAAQTREYHGKAQTRNVRYADTAVTGKAHLVSTLDKTLFKLMFETKVTADYAGETAVYDGSKLHIPVLVDARRSALGAFLFDNPQIIKQGFLGGSLMASWALLDPKNKISKPAYEGLEKIDDREVHVVRCAPKGSGTRVKLFFDAQTFQHMRTTYSTEITPPVFRNDEGRVSSVKFKLVEDFSNYKFINDLRIPLSYKLDYSVELPSRQEQFEWTLNLQRFAFNQKIADDVFAIK
jgi:hypothetical protein